MFDRKRFQGKKICVAVSGGADSVALLHYLKTHAADCGFALSAVHCEHGIRGEESLRDKAFVETLCGAWGITIYTFSEDCIKRAEREKTSLETAARNFRYGCFLQLIASGKADYVATAHHENDEAETVLFRMARGASLSGMSAMKEENGYFLRPFLTWTKAEILQYVEAQGLSYCEDETNYETEATRNKLRLEILPLLERAIPGATGNIARFAALAAEDDALLYGLSAELLHEERCGGEAAWRVAFSEKKPLFTRACLSALKALGVEKDYTAAHLKALYSLQHAERGARLSLPKNVSAEKTENGVLLYRYRQEETEPLGEVAPFNETGFDGGRYVVKITKELPQSDGQRWKILRVDGEKIPKNAVFRFRRDGDIIECFGGDRKSLKKFFNEKKIPPKERGYLPLLADPDGEEVYAICGVEISKRLKVDCDTKKQLYISIRKKSEV